MTESLGDLVRDSPTVDSFDSESLTGKGVLTEPHSFESGGSSVRLTVGSYSKGSHSPKGEDIRILVDETLQRPRVLCVHYFIVGPTFKNWY